jgi:hypothetical protein
VPPAAGPRNCGGRAYCAGPRRSSVQRRPAPRRRSPEHGVAGAHATRRVHPGRPPSAPAARCEPPKPLRNAQRRTARGAEPARRRRHNLWLCLARGRRGACEPSPTVPIVVTARAASHVARRAVRIRCLMRAAAPSDSGGRAEPQFRQVPHSLVPSHRRSARRRPWRLNERRARQRSPSSSPAWGQRLPPTGGALASPSGESARAPPAAPAAHLHLVRIRPSDLMATKTFLRACSSRRT